MAKTAVVLLSGGLDSAACAHFLLTQGFEVRALFIDYGQQARVQESVAARAIASRFGITFSTFKVLTDESFGTGEIVGRNAFFVHCALLSSRGRASVIALGVHAGTSYYDCSPDFISQISRVVAQQTDGQVSVLAPFVEWTKRDVHEYFIRTNTPPSMTYSCEAGLVPACGVCSSCRDREALQC